MFLDYLDHLSAYNQKVNLVADADPRTVINNHIVDCLTVAEVIERLQNDAKVHADPQEGSGGASLVDIGSGAGFPGLVIAISIPDLKVLLVESIGKKARYLSESIKRLKLGDRVELSQERAETLGRTDLRNSFDFATARAVGHLGMIAEMALPLLKEQGWLLCQKSSGRIEGEIKEAGRYLLPLGASRPEVLRPAVQCGKTEHMIVCLKKIGKTDDRFPRPWAKTAREWKEG